MDDHHSDDEDRIRLANALPENLLEDSDDGAPHGDDVLGSKLQREIT